MKLFWDLDGVIRHLTGNIMNGGRGLQYWNEPLANGENLIEHIDKNLSILFDAPPTEYYSTIRELYQINILSHQPEHWQENTTRWLYKHFDKSQLIINYVQSPAQKFDFLSKNDLLIEDYPHFDDYSQIVLIDRPYNQNVSGEEIRIKSPFALYGFLENFFSE